MRSLGQPRLDGESQVLSRSGRGAMPSRHRPGLLPLVALEPASASFGQPRVELVTEFLDQLVERSRDRGRLPAGDVLGKCLPVDLAARLAQPLCQLLSPFVQRVRDRYRCFHTQSITDQNDDGREACQSPLRLQSNRTGAVTE